MCLPLLYTATVTPYFVAMSGEDTPVAVYILDRIVDFMFLVDIFLSFSLAYRCPQTGGGIHIVSIKVSLTSGHGQTLHGLC